MGLEHYQAASKPILSRHRRRGDLDLLLERNGARGPNRRQGKQRLWAESARDARGSSSSDELVDVEAQTV
jgi:hypothetical protein